MIDNIKLQISRKTPETFSRLEDILIHHPNFLPGRPITKAFVSYYHKRFGSKFRFDLRKVQQNGEVLGYREIYINVSPHYHFNNYTHNGNDFTPESCISSVHDILEYLQIKPTDYSALKVVNIEFGVNILPAIDVTSLIEGLHFYKRAPFKVINARNPYFKITGTTKYKEIKAYAKGLQFASWPQYGIDLNTFRFEVKSKQSKNIRRYGINTISDLLELKTYFTMSQELLNEWDYVLITNNSVFSGLKPADANFVVKAKISPFWNELPSVKFSRTKQKYFKMLGVANNFHLQIKALIIDKLYVYQNVEFSTPEYMINKTLSEFQLMGRDRINLENVTLEKKNNVCCVTGLDIPFQKKDSPLLSFARLNDFLQAPRLTIEHLREKIKNCIFSKRFYYIVHNVRNIATNKIHNCNGLKSEIIILSKYNLNYDA